MALPKDEFLQMFSIPVPKQYRTQVWIKDVDLGIIKAIHGSCIQLENRCDSPEKGKSFEFERFVVNLNI